MPDFPATRNYGSINSERVPDVGFSGSSTSTFIPSNVPQLFETVSANIFKVTNSSKFLEQSIKVIGTSRDSQGLRDKIQASQQSTNSVVTSTARDLRKLTDLVRSCGKEQKLQLEKLTGTFKEAVQSYSNIQKVVVSKVKTTFLPSEAALNDTSSSSPSSDAAYLKQGQTTAELRQITNALEFEKGLLLERHQRVLEIENSVLDINQIMKELGAMVHQQAEDINSIEHAIEHVHENTELGTRELEKAASYQSSRRKKNFIILGITLVVVVVFIAILFWR